MSVDEKRITGASCCCGGDSSSTSNNADPDCDVCSDGGPKIFRLTFDGLVGGAACTAAAWNGQTFQVKQDGMCGGVGAPCEWYAQNIVDPILSGSKCYVALPCPVSADFGTEISIVLSPVVGNLAILINIGWGDGLGNSFSAQFYEVIADTPTPAACKTVLNGRSIPLTASGKQGTAPDWSAATCTVSV